MKKGLIAVLIAVLFTVVYVSPFTASASTTTASAIKLVTYSDGDFYMAYTTTAKTVGELLEINGVTLEDLDTVNFALDKELYQGMDIVVKRAFYVLVYFDGAGEKIKIASGTKMGPLALELEKKRGAKYTFDESPAKVIAEGDTVALTSHTEKTFTYARVIPFETEYIDEPSLDKGVTEVAQAGAQGERRITEVVKYSGGKEVSREQISAVVTKEPVKQIVSVGVKEIPKKKPPASAAREPVKEAAVTEITAFSEGAHGVAFDGDSGEFTYVKAYTMTATAYHESTCGKAPGSRGYGVTASGLHVRRGLVAVDPNVIPLGTQLYVEGYGYAIAADTGGAIRGMKIDLYMDSVSECIKFGRGTLTVYVLA